jgi:hypothetical protein
MKSPGIIYRRYRQLKRKILYDKLIAARKVEFCNCHYSVTLDMFGDSFGHFAYVQICSYDYAPAQFDVRKPFVCTNPRECNAFASKWTKDKVIAQFEKELKEWDKKQELYPELVALEWVLDKELSDAKKSPGLLEKFIVSTIEFMEKVLKFISRDKKKTTIDTQDI